MTLRFAAAWLLVLVAAGCSSPDTRDVGRAWYSGHADAAEQRLLELAARDQNGHALYMNELGVLALVRGDLELAYERFLGAYRIMDAFATTDAQEVGAILGTESSKIWRGDPYEQAMNSYYLGVVNLLRGDDDNALAGFKNAIFSDSSREEEWSCDFAPAYFGEGCSYQRLGDEVMAERSLTSAKELSPACPAVDPANRGNLIVIVDVGQGPTKVTAGQHGEATRFVDHPPPTTSCEVLVDGARAGSAEIAGDVYFQATTRGGRVFDRILRGKAIYKTSAQMAGIGALVIADDLSGSAGDAALIGGLALLLSSLFVDASADTRHWTTLPARVQLFRGTVAPGEHEVEIVPVGGGRLAGPAKQMVSIPQDGDAVIYARVLP